MRSKKILIVDRTPKETYKAQQSRGQSVDQLIMKLSKSWRDWSDGQSIDRYARDVPARRWV